MNHEGHTYREIKSQSETWTSTLNSFQGQSAGLPGFFNKPCSEIIFTGCGSTYYLSMTASVIWQSLTGTTARALPASELWLFPGVYFSGQDPLLVTISRSGETTETLRALDAFRERTGRESLAITCNPQSRLARESTFNLIARNAEEKSVAQTRSFTSMLLLAQAAAGLAARQPDYLARLALIPTAFNRLLLAYEGLAKQLAEDFRLNHMVFLGSGANYGLACEAMLKMKEMSLTRSEAFHFLEFRHGPKSIVTEETLVIGLVSESAREEEGKVLAEMRALGAKVLSLSESQADLSAGETVQINSGLDDLARGALYLPVLQLMAYYRAIDKGLNPDRPTNLEAVVRLQSS
jgi:glucosamine--fructose-6-phosphate aminotransferase (isomerizing)